MNCVFQGDVYRAYGRMDTTKVQNVVSLLSQTDSTRKHTNGNEHFSKFWNYNSASKSKLAVKETFKI